jgi:hypothetical protein
MQRVTEINKSAVFVSSILGAYRRPEEDPGLGETESGIVLAGLVSYIKSREERSAAIQQGNKRGCESKMSRIQRLEQEKVCMQELAGRAKCQ